jgi:branched-subunit amino acid transport protein
MTDLWTMAVIVGLALVTVITRGFFVFSSRPWRLPSWVERGLQYAPIAALTAVVVPEVVMTQGHLIATWQDARIFGAAAGMAMFFWRRNTLLTIVAGMVVYPPLHLGLGW